MPPDPKLPAEKLLEISQLGSWGEWVVANNPYAPVELLDSLASSEDWQVRLFVAKNPNTIETTLARMKNDPVQEVKEVVSNQ